MEQLINQITQVVAPYLPRLVSALGILIVGWIIAVIAGALMRGALRRTTLDNRLASWFAGQEAAKKMDVEVWVGKAVYYLVMLFVLVAVFETLGLTMLTEPLRGLLTQIFEFAPRVLGRWIAVVYRLGCRFRGTAHCHPHAPGHEARPASGGRSRGRRRSAGSRE